MSDATQTAEAETEVEHEPKDTGPRTAPPWYSSEEFDEAEIDMSDFGRGVIVVGDPLLGAIGKSAKVSAEGAKGDEQARIIHSAAANMRLYIKSTRPGDDDRGCRHYKPCPAGNAKFDLWIDYAKTFTGKPLARVNAGLDYFMADVRAPKN